MSTPPGWFCESPFSGIVFSGGQPLNQIIQFYMARFGVFGPVLAGMIIMNVVAPGHREGSHRPHWIAFFPTWILAWLVSVLYIQHTKRQFAHNHSRHWPSGDITGVCHIWCFLQDRQLMDVLPTTDAGTVLLIAAALFAIMYARMWEKLPELDTSGLEAALLRHR